MTHAERRLFRRLLVTLTTGLVLAWAIVYLVVQP